jgi:hypothetical protein
MLGCQTVLRLAAAVAAACSNLQGLVLCLDAGNRPATGGPQQRQQQQQGGVAMLALLAAAVRRCLAEHCLVALHC